MSQGRPKELDDVMKAGFIAGLWAGINTNRNRFTRETVRDFAKHAKTASLIVLKGSAEWDAVDAMVDFYDGAFARYQRELIENDGNA